MRGDILLVRGNPNSLGDRLIMWRTKGQYCHVEVDIGNGQSIGALTRGVVMHDIPTGPRVVCVPVGEKLPTGPQLTQALMWAIKRVGDRYGWLDILAQAWTMVFPYGPYLIDTKTLDCSDLVVSFLWMAEYPLPPDDIDVSLVSPNDIARALAPQFPGLLG